VPASQLSMLDRPAVLTTLTDRLPARLPACRALMFDREIRGQLAMLMGGRAAEELTCEAGALVGVYWVLGVAAQLLCCNGWHCAGSRHSQPNKTPAWLTTYLAVGFPSPRAAAMPPACSFTPPLPPQ